MLDRRVSRSTAVLYGLTAAAWVVLIVVQYLGMHLATNLWIFVLGVWGGAWLAAGSFTIASAITVRRRPVVALAILAAATVLAVLVAATEWRHAFGQTWLPVHRSAFVEAADLGRSGALFGGTDRYDAPLPAELAAISVNGRMSVAGECGGEPVLFVPEFTGIPDGAFGYIHVTCLNPLALAESTRDAEYLDGNGDRLIARFPLGDGWWWADGGDP